MLGHFKPHLCRLSASARTTYKRAYCTLCSVLRSEFGLSSSLLVNHEVTMIMVAFAPDTSLSSAPTYTRCPAQLWLRHRPIYAHYSGAREAAGFAILLAWFKAVDWEIDQPSIIKTRIRQILERQLQKVHWDMETSALIRDYAQLTRRHNAGLTEVSARSAELASHMALRLGQQTDTASMAQYANIFSLAGGVVPLADHLLDLSKDQKAGVFNPILDQATRTNRPIATVYQDFYQKYQYIAQQLEQTLSNFIVPAPIFAEIALNSTHYLSERISNVAPTGDDGSNKSDKGTGSPQCACDNCCNDCCSDGCSDACNQYCCQSCGEGCTQGCGDCCGNCCSGCCDNCNCNL